MMTFARPTELGIELSFVDGCRGVIPFEEIPEIGDLSHLSSME